MPPSVTAVCTAALLAAAFAGTTSIEQAMLTARQKGRISFFTIGSILLKITCFLVFLGPSLDRGDASGNGRVGERRRPKVGRVGLIVYVY